MSKQASPELVALLDKITASVPDEVRDPVLVSTLPANPFVGLRPFESEEDMLFFGRREQTIQLLQHLQQNRFLGVVGTSGSGKSSLVRAGLIPKLKAGFVAEQRDQWRVATMRPGESPVRNIALAVLTACGEGTSDDNVNGLVNAIRNEGAYALVERFWPLFARLDVNLLILVDQFEEIFRFGEYTGPGDHQDDESELAKRRLEASEFVAVMLELSKQRQVPVYVVMTMRSDFLGDCDNFFGLPEAMNHSQYLVPRLTRQQRQEAIERPILLFGERIAPRLLDRVLNDVGDESDQLPIMQHALMRTWDEWKREPNGEIDFKHYDAAGTIRDALWWDAERALAETGEITLTKRIFQALTAKDEHGRRVRRPAHIGDIEQVTSTGRDKVMDVIECFRGSGRSFLTLSEGKDRDDLLIDISHESLIRQWKTLREWVDEEAESRAMYLRMSESAARHRARKEGVWRNPALQLALDWRDQNKPNEAWAGRYNDEFKNAMSFLDKSRRRRRIMLLLYAVLFALTIAMLVGMAWYRQRTLVAEGSRKANDVKQQEDLKRQQEATRHEQEIENLKREQQARQAVAIADAERMVAERGRLEAEKQRVEAERQRQIAVALRRVAETKSQIADDRTRDADAQRRLVASKALELQQQLAATTAAVEEKDRQRVLAEEAAKEENRQRLRADQQRLLAEDALNKLAEKQKAFDDAQKAKEQAQSQLAAFTDRQREYMKGNPVTLKHSLLGDIPYHRSKGQLEINQEWIDENIVTTEIPELIGIKNREGGASENVQFHRCGVKQLEAALKEIKEKGLLSRIIIWDRTFVTAATDEAAKYLSDPNGHFLGIAFDINTKFNPPVTANKPLNKGEGSVLELVPIFKQHGFRWAGDTPDTVKSPTHFELIRIDKSDLCPQPKTISTDLPQHPAYFTEMVGVLVAK